MRNAKDHGFMPGNNAGLNTQALQNAVDLKGTITVDEPGIYEIDDTVYIPGNTALVFGEGVYIKRTTCRGYVFVNKGAFTRQYDSNISITGLKLLCNGMNSREGRLITGLRGQVCFFYIRDLIIRDFECLDLREYSFAIQVVTFENIVIENVHIEGDKDGIHLGTGSKFLIRHGVFRTFDDPIAINAHDYTSGNPQLGWIEDGIVEDCYDLDQESTTGYFCRVLAGSWLDWFKGMEVQQSDTVINNGRMYRVDMFPDGTMYRSIDPPVHEEGTKEYDGIKWVMVQDENITYNCGCRNIHFKDIFLKKKRHTAFALTFDKTKYSRGCYPNSVPPVQEDMIFENIFTQNEITTLIMAKTPINTIKLINSTMKNNNIHLRNVDEQGITYTTTNILMSGTTFKGENEQNLITVAEGRTAVVKITGSIKENDSYRPTMDGDIKIMEMDI